MMSDKFDAMLGDAHPDVHGQQTMSDEIEACAGSRRFNHVRSILHERGHHEAAAMVDDWVLAVSHGRYLSMVNIWADWAAEDGTPVSRSSTHPMFRQARDQFCLDYAAFLREFGL